MSDFSARRARMVERQLRGHGIGDERILAAMGEVRRELFLPPELGRRAYDDSALPIRAGQTISQPFMVAAICQAMALRGDERVLEIGTGSGYSAAVLSLLAAEVVSVERLESLSRAASRALDRSGATGVELVVGDGSLGWPRRAPFGAIAVHAAAPEPPPALLAQLAEGGRLVVPVASGDEDILTVVRRRGEGYESEAIGPCRFVPLWGEQGFAEG